MAALFINLYRDEPMLHMPFRILNALIELDESFTIWRQRHALMAHRMLGRQTGNRREAATPTSTRPRSATRRSRISSTCPPTSCLGRRCRRFRIRWRVFSTSAMRSDALR